MQISQREQGQVLILDLDGKMIQGKDDQLLTDAVGEALANGQTNLLLNLDKLGYVDQSVLNTFASVYTQTGAMGGKLKVCRVSPRLMSLFKQAYLTHVLPIYHTEDEAMAGF